MLEMLMSSNIASCENSESHKICVLLFFVTTNYIFIVFLQYVLIRTPNHTTPVSWPHITANSRTSESGSHLRGTQKHIRQVEQPSLIFCMKYLWLKHGVQLAIDIWILPETEQIILWKQASNIMVLSETLIGHYQKKSESQTGIIKPIFLLHRLLAL
jgi:hypothetical protein